MAYCTTDNLIDRYGADELLRLTDRDNNGFIDEQAVSAAIEDASDLIDGYLGGRYTLPLSVVPSVLIKICADIARFNMYDHTVPETVDKNNKAAMDFLKSVGKGEVRLGLSDSNESPASDDQIQIQSEEGVFSRRNSKGFV